MSQQQPNEELAFLRKVVNDANIWYEFQKMQGRINDLERILSSIKNCSQVNNDYGESGYDTSEVDKLIDEAGIK